MHTEDSVAQEPYRASVLLAEDNKVNQQVAVAVLAKGGCEVDVVENGVEACQHVKSKRYDVVLMAIQMPQMDGLEAAREIRQTPQNEDLPIIALTSDALEEELERCRTAGMNDFLAKPFKAHELQETIEKWVQRRDGPGVDESGGRTPDDETPAAPVNLRAFRTAMAEAGVEEVVSATLATYLRESPQKFEALANAVESSDAKAIERAAHSVKSASGAIHADSLAELLQKLENSGKAGDIQEARSLYESVQQEYRRVSEYLRNETE